MSRPPVKIAWGLVSYGALHFPLVYASHMQALAYAQKHLLTEGLGSIEAVGATDRMYTHSAENALVREMLAADYTHLFLTEQDMVLPKAVIPTLLALDQPAASGLYFLRGGYGQPCLYKKSVVPNGNPYPHAPVSGFPTESPFRIDCPGLGCVLIRREVFERVPFPWFDLKEAAYGSDMYFWTKVREAGFAVWVDPTVRCGQMDYVEVGFADYRYRLEHDPDFLRRGYLIGAPGDPARGA